MHDISVQYSCKLLVSLGQCVPASSDSVWKADDAYLGLIWPSRRGRRGRIKKTARRRRFKLPMPSTVLGNVQLIRNKTDESETCI